jgi:uncharacterized membrane protein YqhA
VFYPREVPSLTTFWAHLRSNRRLKRSTLGAAAVVCLVLLALLAVAQVTHVHVIGSDADHCQLCVVMHSAVPFVVMVTAVVLVRIGTSALFLRESYAIIRYWHPTLITRPPPVGC